MKRLTMVSLVLVIAILLCSLCSVFSIAATRGTDVVSDSGQVQLMGDVDGNGDINIFDATTIQCIIAELLVPTDDMLVRAKVCGNEDVSIFDATLIQLYIAELPCDGLINVPVKKPTEAPTDKPTEGEVEIKSASVVVGSVFAKAGETVVVPVTIHKNPGINGMQLNVSYDSALELTKAEKGEALTGLNLTLPGSFGNPSKFLWDGLNENESTNGIVLNLSFKVPSTAKEGDLYTIAVEAPVGSIYDNEFNDVLFDMIGGAITVVEGESKPTQPSDKPTENETEITKPSVKVGSVTAKAGDSVVVPVTVYKNPGINGMQLNISYDQALTLTKAESGNALPSLTLTQPGSFGNPSKFLWDGLNENEKGNGVVLNLTFKAPSSAKSGDSYYVAVTSPDGSIYDLDFNDVVFDMINGAINIK
ncbi:MAG: hypothetical protein IJ331_00390 [Ruminococcus sp.]|nr:hypothetical protein [Ruminococcus sp.]